MTPALTIFILRFIGPIVGGCLAMITDIREKRIPNKLCVALLIIGLLFRVSTGGLNGLWEALGGATVGFCVLFVLHLIGGGGAGDVKFMTAVGAWIGAYHILFVFVLSAIFLGVFTFAWVALRMIQGKSNQTKDKEGNPLRMRIPYAVPATLAIAFRLAWLLLIGRQA